jgi:hypothetical protein
MVKLILLLKRRAGMSFDDFVDYYETTHCVLGRKLLPTALHYERRYLRSLGGVMENSGPDDTYDCITEVWFADRAALDAALAHAAEPGNAALLAADEAKLFDRSKIRFYVVENECRTE